MKEINSNEHAWSQLSKAHYEHYKEALTNKKHTFNKYILEELGDVTGEKIIHLQCNTGADTVLLAGMASHVVGVDLVPDNIYYASLLAKDLGIKNVDFIQSDIMDFMEKEKFNKKHRNAYDIVFVSEGAIGWLPDLNIWGKTIKALLKENGFCYVFDSHPFYLMFNEELLSENIFSIQYPYFDKEPDESDSIGGYASQRQYGVKAYYWMYTISDIINALATPGLRIEYFHEFEELFFDMGQMTNVGNGLYAYDFNKKCFPMSFSIKASNLQNN